MENRAEEFCTVTVTVENMRTGSVQATTFQGVVGGTIQVIETRTRGTCSTAEEILQKIAAQFEQETMNAKITDCSEKQGVWYEVAKKTKEESLCVDGEGNYHMITTKRAGASKEGLRIVQKRSRELMSEDDARYWALENLRMEECEKAFPNE